MLLRIMNHLPSGTDFPERFQISVLYRISLMVSIGILHKFNPSIFNSMAVSPNVSGTFWHLARSRIKKNVPWHILAPREVACDNLHLRASAHLWHVSAFLCNREFLGISCYIKKAAAMPTIHVLPPFYPIIYMIFSGHMPGSYLSFEARATSPLSARSARTFGMTISPLKKSAKDHTSSSFRQEPITMQTTTIRE